MNGFNVTLVVFIWISIAVLSLVWLVYIRYRISIKHPNSMFFVIVNIQIIGLFMLSLTIIITNQIPSFNNFSGSPFIVLLRYLIRFCEIFTFNYIMLINIEILIKLKKKLVLKHQSRLKIYGFLSTFLAVFFTIFGRLNDDQFLKMFGFGLILFQIYSLFVCILLITIICYLYCAHCPKIRSKDMLILVWQTCIGLVVALTQVCIYFFTSRDGYDNSLNEFSYFLISIEGVIEFAILYTSPNMRNYINNTLRCARIEEEGTTSSSCVSTSTGNISLISKKTEDVKCKQGNQGFISEIFDNITKHTLIKMFIAISLRFLKAKSTEKKEDLEFSFDKNDIQLLRQKLDLELLSSVNTKELALLDCNYQIFSKIRQKFLVNSIFGSLANTDNYEKLANLVSESGGRSSSFIFVTADNKFVIKTVTKHEYKVFKHKLLYKYSQRILGCEQSKIVRIFALLKLKHLQQFVIIMENIVDKKDQSIIFDLKGSKVGRNTKDVEDNLNPPRGVVLKDVNFELYGNKIVLHPDQKEILRRTLNEDFLMLKECGIMDYSILLCIRENDEEEKNRLSFLDLTRKVVMIGIIDIFQDYNLCKISETAMKVILHNANEVSSMNPEEYYQRITNYLSQILL